MKHSTFVTLIFFTLQMLFGSAKNTYWDAQVVEQKITPKLALASKSELKKLHTFKKKLSAKNIKQKLYLDEVRQYTKDSLQILAVKLISIKELDRKQLLDKDILLNTAYYLLLLEELKESDIQFEEYAFLENKLVKYQIIKIQKKYALSKGINWVLLLILVGLLVRLVLKKSSNKVNPDLVLSVQEKKVKDFILEGKSNKEIAEALFVSLNTVKTHITNLYQKLEISNRKELMLKFKNSTQTST